MLCFTEEGLREVKSPIFLKLDVGDWQNAGRMP